ncbi:serine-rich adhesin for platelets-like [Tigriopus californicus]|uniref:serine-rich adhesin for platelets-like n=1 Tax=Tigriopus californicus TaxID=6832 RepID=UPI0027DA7AF8|nr:serine-rich adhesin for platelets-like [Tigriopus californicus]
MNSWTRKLPSLDLFKKLRIGEQNFADRFDGDDSIVHWTKRRPSQSSVVEDDNCADDSDDTNSLVDNNLFGIAGLVLSQNGLRQEDAVYDQSDNLARDCREFYERRLDAAEEVAKNWGITPPDGTQFSSVCDSSSFRLGGGCGGSFRSACSSGYFSLVSHPGSGIERLHEKLSSLVEEEAPENEMEFQSPGLPSPSPTHPLDDVSSRERIGVTDSERKSQKISSSLVNEDVEKSIASSPAIDSISFQSIDCSTTSTVDCSLSTTTTTKSDEDNDEGLGSMRDDERGEEASSRGSSEDRSSASASSSSSSLSSTIQDGGTNLAKNVTISQIHSSSDVEPVTHPGSSKSNSRPNFLNDPSFLQTKLDLLRTELLSLIHLDNELFKQLLTLNDTIEEMKEGSSTDSPSSSPMLPRTDTISAITSTPFTNSVSMVVNQPESDLDEHDRDHDGNNVDIENDDHDRADENGSDQEQEINDLLDEALDLTSLCSTASTPSSVRSLSVQQTQGYLFKKSDSYQEADETGDDDTSSSSSVSWSSMSPGSTLSRDPMPKPMFLSDSAHTDPTSLPHMESLSSSSASSDPIRSVIRSQSILLRSGFQRQRVSFPATGKNKRGRGSWANPPVKRELPVHALLIPNPLRESDQGPSSLPGFHTLPPAIIKESREKKLALKASHEHKPSPVVDNSQLQDPEQISPLPPPSPFDNDEIDVPSFHLRNATAIRPGDDHNGCRDTCSSETISLPPAWKHVKQSSFDSGFIRGRSSGSNSSRHSAVSAGSSYSSSSSSSEATSGSNHSDSI